MSAAEAPARRVLPCGCYADSRMGHTCASGGGAVFGPRIEGFICLVPNYWGWGTTPQAAVKACRKAARGNASTAKGKRAIYALPPGALNATVTEMGFIVWDWTEGSDKDAIGSWVESAP